MKLLQCDGQKRSQRIFLAGDSSLDNKYWLFDEEPLDSEQHAPVVAPAVGKYAEVLTPKFMVKDVAYWTSKEAIKRGKEFLVINCAVEESTVADRHNGHLLPQDQVIRDHITENDILIVSVGGNDIALKPSFRTILSMAGLVWLTPQSYIERSESGLGMNHIIYLFKDKVQNYINSLTEKQKPRAVIVCCIYYPCTIMGGWASSILRLMGYGRNPSKLHALIRIVYQQATSQITLSRRSDGTNSPESESASESSFVPVIPIPLFEVLDANNADDYIQQVEPSILGGEKMAIAFFNALENHGLL